MGIICFVWALLKKMESNTSFYLSGNLSVQEEQSQTTGFADKMFCVLVARKKKLISCQQMFWLEITSHRKDYLGILIIQQKNRDCPIKYSAIYWTNVNGANLGVCQRSRQAKSLRHYWRLTWSAESEKCPEQKWNGREGEIDKLLKNTGEERVVLDHKEKSR